MSDHIERACTLCGSLLHHKSECHGRSHLVEPSPRIDLVDLLALESRPIIRTLGQPGTPLMDLFAAWRKAGERLPPWYDSRRLGGESIYLHHDDPRPCGSCGKECFKLRDSEPRCNECETMLRFAGLDLEAFALPALGSLPVNWHLRDLPSQRAAGEAYAASLRA